MKDISELRRQVDLVVGGLSDLYQSLTPKKPHSVVFIRGVIEDVLVHASAALFQVDCLSGETEALHLANQRSGR